MQPWSGCLCAGLALLSQGAQEGRSDARPREERAEAVEARPADAAELLAVFAAMPGLEVRFREEKHLALLLLPLESEGSLYFLPPGYLTRVVTAPEPSRLTITPAELRMQDRDGESVLDLRQSETLRAFVGSLVRVFAGDRAALERSYVLAYEPSASDPERWSLTLTPRAKPLTEMLRALVLSGRGRAVTGIELVEPNGDRTVTTVVSADPRRRFQPEERARLFGIRDDG